MTDQDLLLLVGPVVATVGVLLMVFHRPFVRLVKRLPGQRQVEAGMPYLFKPTTDGHVRILWVISAGWVLIGVIFTLTGIGVIPTAS